MCCRLPCRVVLRLPCLPRGSRRLLKLEAATLSPRWPLLCSRQELLAMVPRPVAAVLLLFPITEATEAARKQGACWVMLRRGRLLVGALALPFGNNAAYLLHCAAWMPLELQSSRRWRRREARASRRAALHST